MITKYGYTIVGIVSAFAAILVAVGFLLQSMPWRVALFGVAGLMLIFTLNFFRDPNRTSPNRDDAIVAPADGRVLFTKPVVADRYLQGEATQISIFMSPLDVHVNRAPVTGEVEFLEYHEGKFHKAFEDKAAEENERMEIGMRGPEGKVFFTQVAGAVARRIVNEMRVGKTYRQGERFGMIRFGSRVDVLAPAGWKPVVGEGDRTTAGETILFIKEGKAE
ncbi:MAG: phosphatidylserine decarboxylase family protein [Ignavibacteriales bacterium]|nr:phosphatidylserine decarboxylase family protein [Ignavibacteriales bacterium]